MQTRSRFLNELLISFIQKVEEGSSKARFPLTYFAVAGEKFRQPETLLVVL